METIGDAYTCASGVPIRNPDHAAELADMALAIRHAVAEFKVSRFLSNESLTPSLQNNGKYLTFV